MMPSVTRRTMLAASGLGAAGLALPAFAAQWQGPALAIYDSRIQQSRMFAREAGAKGLRLLDVAEEEADFWRLSRAGFGLAEGERLTGLTGWSDWVALRGLLHEQRRSIRSLERVEIGGRALFAWEAT